MDPGSTSRYLLRALLREASYLPDATARVFVHRRIIARYRDYPEYKLLNQERSNNLLESGRKHLRQLQRANNGELRALSRIFDHVYGRAGKRRYELMKPLLKKIHSDAEGAESPARKDSMDVHGHPLPLPHALEGPFITKKDTLQFRISNSFPLLSALARSQTKQSATLHEARSLKSNVFDMPLRNLWLREQPRKRQANAAKKWYADLLDKLQPPLPEVEWLQLRSLATGQVPWKGPSRRKPTSRQVAYNWSSWRSTFSDEADSAGRTNTSTLLKSELQIAPLQRLLQLHNGRDVGHQITARFMRRLYASVLMKCPLMRYDSATSKWIVNWFDHHRRGIETIVH